jgi:hypothetical protein
LGEEGAELGFAVLGVVGVTENNDVTPLIITEPGEAHLGEGETGARGGFEDEDAVTNEKFGHHGFRRDFVKLEDEKVDEGDGKNGLKKGFHPLKKLPEEPESALGFCFRSCGRRQVGIAHIDALVVKLVKNDGCGDEHQEPQKHLNQVECIGGRALSGVAEHEECEEYIRKIMVNSAEKGENLT